MEKIMTSFHSPDSRQNFIEMQDAINNLQMDIMEIDDEIENILLETEDANCNVAQGYKVFKRLKELRLARKAKKKELDCLCAMTEYIDCDALADACEANLTEVAGIMGITGQKASIQIVDQTIEMQVVDKMENMVG